MVRKRKLNRAKQAVMGLAPTANSIDDAVQTIVADLIKGLSCPPTPLAELFPRLGVVDCISADIPISGELQRRGKELTIVYSTHLSPATQRFTIAHELGHAIFEQTGPGCPRRGADVERLCDEFGAEILMPTAHFSKRIPESMTLKALLQLARDFGTSLSSTAIRASKLTGCTVFAFRDSALAWAFGPARSIDPRTLSRDRTGETGLNISETIYYPDRNTAGCHRLEWTNRGALKLAMLTPIDHAEVGDRLTREDLLSYVQQLISSVE